MAFLLWKDEAADDALDLGNPFLLLKAFAELSRAAKGENEKKWAELFSVPQFGEQTIESKWAQRCRDQARRFLVKYRSKLSERARWILERLSKEL